MFLLITPPLRRFFQISDSGLITPPSFDIDIFHKKWCFSASLRPTHSEKQLKQRCSRQASKKSPKKSAPAAGFYKSTFKFWDRLLPKKVLKLNACCGFLQRAPKTRRKLQISAKHSWYSTDASDLYRSPLRIDVGFYKNIPKTGTCAVLYKKSKTLRLRKASRKTPLKIELVNYFCKMQWTYVCIVNTAKWNPALI